MGMAASQARYLALVARKSNCEYEGQQINQARTALSNQSANLFNQMLGLKVPVPPSTQDFTTTKYSFTDGVNAVTIDNWYQLATPEEEYNYAVTYHYNADVYTGAQKKMNDPQVQFSGAIPAVDKATYNAQIATIQAAQTNLDMAQTAYDMALANYQTKLVQASKLTTYADNSTYNYVTNSSNLEPSATTDTYKRYYQVDNNQVKEYYVDSSNKVYIFNSETENYDAYNIGESQATVSDMGANFNRVENSMYFVQQQDSQGGYLKFTGKIGTATSPTELYLVNGEYCTYDTNTNQYTPVSGSVTGLEKVITTNTFTQVTNEIEIKTAVQQLKDLGALPAEYSATNIYKDTIGNFVFKSDLDELVSSGGKGTSTILPLYYPNNSTSGRKPEGIVSVQEMNDEITSLQGLLSDAKQRLDLAKSKLDTLSIPSYVGNCALTPLYELNSEQMAEIAQIIKDMQAQNVNTNITNCFDTVDGTYNADTYSGGIYSFKLNGITYYTTYYDLADSANSGEGINHIDGQQKLAYYNASYVSTKIEKTENALLETDSQGRFSTIRLGDNTVTYTLNMETETDEAAYQDAMNQYYYDNAIYDKTVQDINAKTSIIQQQDQQLELRLKQLDTEQNALSTEMEAVQKVVKDNVEKSFKTFGG